MSGTSKELAFTIHRPLLGKPQLKYHCLACKESLQSRIDEAGTNVTCPACQAPYIVPGRAARLQYEQAEAKRLQEEHANALEHARAKQEAKAQRDAKRAAAKEKRRIAAAKEEEATKRIWEKHWDAYNERRGAVPRPTAEEADLGSILHELRMLRVRYDYWRKMKFYRAIFYACAAVAMVAFYMLIETYQHTPIDAAAPIALAMALIVFARLVWS